MRRLQYDSSAEDVFRVALPDAITWYSRLPVASGRASKVDDPDPTLRSMRLCPDLFSTSAWLLVWTVVQARHNALHAWRFEVPDILPTLNGGRLLFLEPATSLSDGAANMQSHGFFDNHNASPWDTWLCFADQRFLVSWVPPEFLDAADAGVRVNPERCIFWADQTDAPFTSFLRKEGLL